VNVDGGSQLLSAHGTLADQYGSNGTVTVSGAGSKWTVGDDIWVANAGTASLNIQAGGEVDDVTGYLGYSYYHVHTGLDYYSSGSTTVTGAGSKWINSGDLYVGDYGAGTLKIQAGGEVTSNNGIVGYFYGGNATISDSGSKWINNGNIHLYSASSRNPAPGAMTVGSGALVSTQTFTDDGNLTVSGGTLQVGTVSGSSSAWSVAWNGGTIQNYDAYTDLSVSSNLKFSLSSVNTSNTFQIDAGRTGTVNALLTGSGNGIGFLLT